jgi:hypothetical protein
MSFRSDKTIETVAGLRNYMPNSKLDSAVSLGYNRGTVTWSSGAPSGTPTVGSAASITTLALSSTSPLNGLNSLNVASSAAWSQGQGVITDILTIDKQDRARVLQGSFRYEVVSGGSNANWSGTSSNTLSVWIYDITNTRWEQPQGVYNLIQSSGVGECTFTFQTAANASQYRVFIVAANASSGALNLRLDEFYLGTRPTFRGVPATDWVSYTPTITNGGSTSSNTGLWRRVGDSMQIQIRTVYTGAGSGVLSYSLPAGYSIDTAKIPTTTQYRNNFGSGTWLDSGTDFNNIQVIYNSSTTVSFINESNSAEFNGSLLANGDNLYFEFTVPIVGWSSNVSMSSDTETRVVALRSLKSTTQAIPNSTDTIITSWDAGFSSTHSTFDNSTGKYTFPVSGFYNILAYVDFVSNSTGIRYCYIRLNNATIIQYGSTINAINGDSSRVSVSATRFFNAGDIIDIGCYQNTGSDLNIRTLAGSTSLNISRISGTQTIAATEVVAFRGTKASQGSITSGGTWNTVQFTSGEVTNDTHGKWLTATNEYEAPVSGFYDIRLSCRNNSTFSGDYIIIGYRIDGGSELILGQSSSVSGAAFGAASGSDQRFLNAGQKVQMRIITGSSTTINNPVFSMSRIS